MLDFLTLFAATLAVAGCATVFNCVEGKGDPTSIRRNVEAFSSITIDGSFDVVLQQGPVQSVQVVAQENLQPIITTSVSDQTLTIGSTECFSTRQGVKVLVTIPDVHNLRINGSGSIAGDGSITGDKIGLYVEGSGDIALDLNAGQLVSSIDGSGDVRLKGRASVHAITVNGSGTVHAYDLPTERCTVEINGSGDSNVNVTSSLTVAINGVGDVKYKGGVTDVRQDVNGVGSVKAVQ